MGQTKETSSGSQTGQTTYTPTAEETELNKLYLERQRAAQGGMMSAQEQGLNLVNLLLTGQGLPGYLGQLPGGISPEAIGTQASRLAKQYGAGFQQAGIADSGVAFRETSRGIANELLFPSEQFNLQNLMQLLNLGVGGQAQVQAPIIQQGGQLSQALAGLRGITQAGTTTGRQTTKYDFFTSPFTSALLGAAPTAAGLGSEAYGKFLWR